jgi:aminomethyltransferase
MSDSPDWTHAMRTPLYAAHLSADARMVAFAGYAMPVQYPTGLVTEHMNTRQSAGLFDVSHMGQAFIDSDKDPGPALEALVPGDIQGLAPGHSRYSVLLNKDGGIIDDLMISRFAELPNRLFVVVNADRKQLDFEHLRQGLGSQATITEIPHRALIALQGPKAIDVLRRFAPKVDRLRFMQITTMHLASIEAIVTRSGYTGEDGFEISIPALYADVIWNRLAAEPEVTMVGLGARDTLRLEAGLCLYGHDIDETISPIEASLNWVIPKRRRLEANFPGAERILRELADGPARKRVGLKLEGRAPAREGTEILSPDGVVIGVVTSGTHAPSLGYPIAMGYVATAFAVPGTQVGLSIRGKTHAATIAPLPFSPHHYVK